MALLMDLPCTIKGFIKVTAEPDGDYTNIVINSRMSQEAQRRTYLHEYGHLSGHDMDGESADRIEKERHGKENGETLGYMQTLRKAI